ncbi:flagellar motor switch protein FliG [Arthrobacter cryoconiti]|uniref:Flagellar motor switch protein FliG n=1 Tax=Arthrobacter cryoconiti TaxID=748907 RepID=A0ABV8QWX4_9MICC|nr:flagellar motor switch protein FliG [Arthrobacter cryoconiti]MCC9067339.1 flagellar motor switch protein FliG [Arthrobacter cryoconiti]
MSAHADFAIKSLPSLSGAQKAAAVLMQLSRDAAAAVMGHLNDEEAEAIATEIVRMRRVQPQVADAVIEEIHNLAVSGRTAALGGKEFAAGLLEASFGSERAAGLMDRLAADVVGKRFEFLDNAGPAQVMSLLEGELPQTIALVLAHLNPETASASLSAMLPSARTEVAQAIAAMGPAAPEAVDLVAETLKQKAAAMVAPRARRAAIGGVQPLVDIINRADSTTEKALMDDLAIRNPGLAAELREKMLGLADLIRFAGTDVQKVLRGIEPITLAMAFKGMAADAEGVIRENISERNRELLDSEIEALGAVRSSDAAGAQAQIVRSMRSLFANGEITLREDDGADDEH